MKILFRSLILTISVRIGIKGYRGDDDVSERNIAKDILAFYFPSS